MVGIFGSLLRFQENLDSKIVMVREKDEIDVKLAMLAEAIEANEEMGRESYKTWKSKDVDTAKLYEEVVDILFFILQYYIKFPNDIRNGYIDVIHQIDKDIIPEIGMKKQLFKLIKEINKTDEDFSLMSIYREFWILCNVELGLSLVDVREIYVAKYNKNLARIGGSDGWL